MVEFYPSCSLWQVFSQDAIAKTEQGYQYEIPCEDIRYELTTGGVEPPCELNLQTEADDTRCLDTKHIDADLYVRVKGSPETLEDILNGRD